MLTYLQIKDFVCFCGTQRIDFTGHDGVILLTGTYDEDPQMSNQAGKTTVLHAILYALYGWMSILCKKETDLIYEENGEVADYMEVEMGLDIGGQHLVIRRGRTNNNKPIFSVEGVGGGAEELQQNIEKLLGMPAKDFLSTTFFRQGDIHVFMDALPAEKKEYLKRWLDFSRWDTYADKAKAHAAAAQTEVERLLREVAALDTVLAEPLDAQAEQQLLAERTERQRQQALAQQVMADVRQQLEALPDNQAQLAAKAAAEQQIVQHRQQLQAAERAEQMASQQVVAGERRAQEIQQLEALEVEDAAVQQKMTELLVAVQQIQADVEATTKAAEAETAGVPALDDQLTDARKRRTTIGTQLADKQALVERIRQLGSCCPFDRNPCERVGPGFISELDALCAQYVGQFEGVAAEERQLLADRQAVEAAHKQLQAKAQGLQQALRTRMTDQMALQRQLDQQQARRQQVAALKAQPDPAALRAALAEAQANVEAWRAQVAAAEDQARSAQAALDAYAATAQQHQDLQTRANNAQALQAGAAARITEIDRALGQYDALRQRQAKAMQDKQLKQPELQAAQETAGRWRFIDVMCRREIPSVLTENAFEEVEDETNFILRGLQSNMSIQFQATRELKTKEDTCSVCAAPFPARAKSCPSCGYGERHNKRKDELVLDVHQGMSTRSFSLVSGGGKALISIALRIALTKLLQRRRGSQIDWLHLDEVVGTLDPVNRQAVVRIIFDILLTVMGFRQIFVISHTDIAGSGAHVLQVQRHDGYSTVGWL